LLISFSHSELNGQQLYGSITGRVTDSSGAGIPGAEVTAVNNANNYTQTAVSNETGTYSLQNVPRGTYTLRIGLPGFKEFVKSDVVVTVNNVTREDAQLEVGEISEQVTVTAASTLLQTDTADIHVQVESKEITDLPLGAFRNYQSLLNLVPGATPARFQNAITDTPGRSLSTNINGTARNNNNTRIDGAQSVNIWLPHHAAYVPPSETIEVASVSTNSFDAEQGFAGGAAITVITKSGTNEFNGSAFFFHENDNLNARDFFNFLDVDGDGRADKPEGKRSITGFTVGGPILRDKLFFFGGWEGVFQRLARTDTRTLPTADQRMGDFSAFLPGNPDGNPATIIYDPLTGNPDGSGRTPFPNNVIPENRLSPAALRMQGFLPLPNLDGVLQNFERSGTEAMDRYNYDVKIDWLRTDSHQLWGKFSWMDAEVAKDPIFGPEGGGGAIGGGGDGVGVTDVKVYGIGHNWTLSPTLLMDANFGFTDMDQEVITADLDLGNFGIDVLGIPGTNTTESQSRACVVDGLNRCGGVPEFVISGFSSLGQVDGWNPLFRDENSVTFSQNMSWTRGNHEFRWGYDLVKHMLNHWQPEIGPGPRGLFDFNRERTSIPGADFVSDQNAWAAFLLGVPSSVGKSLQWELMTGNEWQHAVYLRDRWQVNPKLTLSLGLRYEYYPLVSRDDREMEYLDFDTFEVVLANDTEVSKRLFAPRLGFAYRLTDNDVLRSGYGITYNPLPFIRPLRGSFPLTVVGEFQADNPFEAFRVLDEGIPEFVGPETSPGARIPLPPFVSMRTMPRDRLTRGYIQSWNLMYERRLPANFVVSLGYVGTQTVHQMARQEVNYSAPGGGTTGRQFYPLSEVSILYWDGWLSSNYHALQVSLNRRFTDGLFMRGAYTYGKAINMVDDDGTPSPAWNDPALIHRNRAEAGYNRPHMFQLATVYELPFGRGDSIFDSIVRNWQINGIFSVNENTPFTVGSSSPLNAPGNDQTADQVKSEVVKLGGIGRGDPYYDPDAFQPVSRVPGQSCTYLDCYGNSGRNILRGPTWVNLDLSIFRNFPVTEDVGVEFRAELFNVTNTPHFSNPNSNASSSSFMFITATNDNAPERVLRFGLRLAF